MKIWEDFIKEITKYIPSSLECEIKMMNSKNSLTRFANSHIHQNVEEETSDIYLTLHQNKRTITLTSNLTSINDPKVFVEKALTGISNSPLDKNWAGMPDKSLRYEGYERIKEETPDARAEKVKDFINSGKKLNSAGYCSTSISNYFVWNSEGLTSSDTATSCFIDGIHRTDSSAGSSHRGAKKLSEIDSATAGKEAALLAKDSENPVDIEPGKYEVVLGNEAVSTILVFLAVYGFNAKNKIDGMSPITIGENQFDEQITLYDNPFRDDSIGFKIDASGAAKKQLSVINKGVSSSYFHTRRTAKELKQQNTFHELYGWGDSFGGIGTNLYLESGNKSKEEMIKEVKKGIYINEFWYCRVLDPITQVVTGLNRNGSFLIEDGKITKPVGRLRFTQSFISALGEGNVISVGDSSRYADSEFGDGILHVPMLHLKDFSFTGGVSG